MNLLTRLYPKAWRSRYQVEFEALLDDRGVGLADMLDIARAALDARLHPQVCREQTRPAPEYSTRIVRVGAVGAVLGGVMLVIIGVVPLIGLHRVTAVLPDWLQFLLPLFFLIAVVSLYSLSRGHMGALGRAGTGLILVGPVLAVTGMLGLAYSDALWFLVILGLFDMCLGFVMFGAAIIRAGLLGPWSFMPLALGVLGLAAIFNGEPAHSKLGYSASMVLWLLFALAWVLLGYALWSRQSQTPAGPEA